MREALQKKEGERHRDAKGIFCKSVFEFCSFNMQIWHKYWSVAEACKSAKDAFAFPTVLRVFMDNLKVWVMSSAQIPTMKLIMSIFEEGTPRSSNRSIVCRFFWGRIGKLFENRRLFVQRNVWHLIFWSGSHKAEIERDQMSTILPFIEPAAN